jgi:hypothetical protein
MASPGYITGESAGVLARGQQSPARQPEILAVLKGAAIVLAVNELDGVGKYRKAAEVYRRTDELALYFNGNPHAWFVDQRYPEQLHDLFDDLGVPKTPRTLAPKRRSDSAGNVIIADYHGRHQRGLKGFDPDFDVDGILHAVEHPTKVLARYIWETIAVPFRRNLRGEVESSNTRDYYAPKRKFVCSKLGTTLAKGVWLPQDDTFVQASELSLDQLPELFTLDETVAAALNMKVDEVARLASKVGVDADDITLLKDLKADPYRYAQVQKWFQAGMKPQFPIVVSSDGRRRAERIGRSVIESPEKTYEIRSRSVRVSDPVSDPKEWLRTTYTNSNGQMICQICQFEMPFRGRDGQPYFEAVEFAGSEILSFEHAEAYLALCPVCAAKYKEFVKREPSELRTLVTRVLQNAAPIVTINLGEERGSLRFVDIHFLDIQLLLAQQAGSGTAEPA